MSPFDYVSVLLSFVISLVVAQVLTGISHMIHSGVRRVSIPLLYWIGYVLFNCVDYWFSIWGLRDHHGLSFGYVSLLLIFAAFLFLTARAVVPESATAEPIDMTAFYDRNRRRMLGLLFCYFVLGTIVNLTLPGFASSELLAIALALMALNALAWWSPKSTIQYLVISANFILTSYYAWNYEPRL